jgi:hypothetical protein
MKTKASKLVAYIDVVDQLIMTDSYHMSSARSLIFIVLFHDITAENSRICYLFNVCQCNATYLLDRTFVTSEVNVCVCLHRSERTSESMCICVNSTIPCFDRHRRSGKAIFYAKIHEKNSSVYMIKKHKRKKAEQMKRLKTMERPRSCVCEDEIFYEDQVWNRVIIIIFSFSFSFSFSSSYIPFSSTDPLSTVVFVVSMSQSRNNLHQLMTCIM